MASARICLQWTLIIFNTFSILLGIAATLGSVFELFKCMDGTADCPEKITQIVIAGFLIISAIVGCCGAVNGSIKTLCALLLMLLALMAAHGWMLWRYNEPRQVALVELMVSGVWLNEVVKSGAMDELQQKYECCGKYSFMDYVPGNSNGTISNTCFLPNTILNNNPYSPGCQYAVTTAYLKLYRIQYWTHVGLLGFEAFGLLLTSILIWKLMAKTRRYHY